MKPSLQGNPLAGLPLDYLIGKDGETAGTPGRITEVGYDAQARPTLGPSIKYCNLFNEKWQDQSEAQRAEYGPYLHTSDTAAQYGEGQIDPAGPGWSKNLGEQFTRAGAQGFAFVELDNCDAYSVADVLRAISFAAGHDLKVIAKNPGLMKGDASPIVGHPSVFGIIAERDAGHPIDMAALRERAGKPDLPVWFVFFGDGIDAARQTAIEAKAFSNMGVTHSSVGEYESSTDILVPLPSTGIAPKPQPDITLMPAATAPTPLDTMTSMMGLEWSPSDGANPKIIEGLQLIGTAFPKMADYCNGEMHIGYFSWCGWTVAVCMVKRGIEPAWRPTDTDRFLWARAWLKWGTPVTTPQPGDVLVFDFGGGDSHVTLFDHDNNDGSTWSCRGGNQSHAVKLSPYRKSQCIGIRRPPDAGAVTQPPAIIASSAAKSGVSNFGKCVKLVLVHEGGNDDDPRDPGGRTSRGILQREWDVWRTSHSGLPSDVWQAPQDQVEAIYRQKYWDPMRCDDLPNGVDYAVFDYGVNSGIGRSPNVLQRLVGVAVDGEIGPETIAATSRADARSLINQISDERLAFLQGLGTWSTFGRGWSTRVAEVRAAALTMAATAKLAPQPAPIGGETLPQTDPNQTTAAGGMLPLIGGALLILKFMENSQMTTQPAGQGFDFTKLLAIFQNPTLQKVLSNQPITLSELLGIVPLLHGQSAPLLPAPTALTPSPEPPVPLSAAPAVAPAAATPPWVINASGGLASIVAGLGLGVTGLMGTPFGDAQSMAGMLWPLISIGAAALGVPAPVLAIGKTLVSKLAAKPKA